MDMRQKKQVMRIAGAPAAAENAGSARMKNPLGAEPRLSPSIYLPDAATDTSALAASAAYGAPAEKAPNGLLAVGRDQNRLYAPAGDRKKGWNHDRHAFRYGLHTAAATHPGRAGTLILGGSGACRSLACAQRIGTNRHCQPKRADANKKPARPA